MINIITCSRNIMGLLKAKFFKEFLGIFFFGDAVDTDIHEEPKNKITTKFKEKRRLSTVPLSIIFILLISVMGLDLVKNF